LDDYTRMVDLPCMSIWLAYHLICSLYGKEKRRSNREV
jgi:hypothetical protein